jgi:hypothetical protein
MKNVISIEDYKMKVAIAYIADKYGYEKGKQFENGEFYPNDDKQLENILNFGNQLKK